MHKARNNTPLTAAVVLRTGNYRQGTSEKTIPFQFGRTLDESSCLLALAMDEGPQSTSQLGYEILLMTEPSLRRFSREK